ncbi:DUF1173 family protein [Pantoea sp. App145]|uniref:DUF1173 family protein n=1 Tax=Pantoea sp. App145 TaxID=3071567 RepID=UPI003A80EE40
MAEKKEYWVNIHNLAQAKNHTFSPERRKTHSDAYQKCLRRAWDTRYIATCSCDRTKELRLYIRSVNGGEPFSLRRFPHTGSHHAEDCIFHSRVNSDGAASTYSGKALTEDPDGTVQISLGYSLQVKEVKTTEPDALLPARRNHADTKLGQMTLLGVLHLLWENSEMNAWSPAFEGKRSSNTVARRLDEQAKLIRQGTTHLNDILLLQDRKNENEARTTYAINNNRRLIVICQLEVKSAQSGLRTLPVGSFVAQGMPFLNIDNVRWNDTLKRFPRASAWWREGKNVVLIAVTDVPKQGSNYKSAKVRQACLMMVNDQWLPLDSSFEGIVADRLVSERRAFVKPLIYDSAISEYHMDFCLTDTPHGDVYPMEVWGRDDDDYTHHREEKTEWYNARHPQAWWEWDAVVDPKGVQMPVFPDRSEYYSKKYPYPTKT